MIPLRWTCAILACAAAGSAGAQVSVVSHRPDAVTLTVYRQGVAQVTETREVELPAGPVSLVFEGVVDTLLPQSAVMNGADRSLVETNFDFDQLSPTALLERSIGKAVTIVRTNRRTGTVVRQAATIVSASGSEGVVIRTVEGNEALKCSGLPERLEFNEIPDNLRTTPTLSVRLAAGAPGKRSVTVSYLVHGISWSADYVARLNAKSTRMELIGWATLKNNTSVAFDKARVQLVSGELQLQYGGNGGSSPPYYSRQPGPGDEGYEPEYDEVIDPEPRLPLDKCMPLAPISKPELGDSQGNSDNYDADELEEVTVTGTRIQRENLGDYKLYRLPEPTDLKSRQTKQAIFLSMPRVKVQRVYKLETRDFESDAGNYRYVDGGPRVSLIWHNTRAVGLGEPLPGGTVRVFERFTDDEVFAGAARMADIPVGLDVSIVYGFQVGVTAERSRDPLPEDLDDGPRASTKVQHRLVNEKTVAVTVLVQSLPSYRWRGVPRISNSSAPVLTEGGVPAWRIQIPARSARVLRYEIEADDPDYGRNN